MSQENTSPVCGNHLWACPYCAHQSQSISARARHARAAHPDKFKEGKPRDPQLLAFKRQRGILNQKARILREESRYIKDQRKLIAKELAIINAAEGHYREFLRHQASPPTEPVNQGTAPNTDPTTKES